MKNKLAFIFCQVMVLLMVSWATASNPPSADPVARIEQINQQLREQMLLSKAQIENEDYLKAEQTTNGVIKDIDQLIEAFMPLDERIRELLEKEKDIYSRTEQYQKEIRGDEVKINSGQSENLLHDQIVNREKTERASSLLERELNAAAGNDKPGTETKPDIEEKKALIEISELLKMAAKDQSNAIASIEVNQNKKAMAEEQSAIDNLQKALEKLRQKSQSNQQKNQQSQASNNSKQQQSEDKNAANSNKQNQQTEEKRINDKDAKKLSPEEALKMLLKLRKQAADEKERRKQQYGDAFEEGQIPVEKDW